MKNKFAMFMIGTAISFMIFASFSCNIKSVSRKDKIDYSTKKMLLSYLEQHKKIDTSASFFIDTLINKLDWTNYSQSMPNSSDATLFYVPLNYNRNKTGITFIYYNKLQQVYYAHITNFPEIKNSKNRKNNKNSFTPIDILNGFYRNKVNEYTGSIRSFSLSNNYDWEYGYENGKQKFEKRITSYDPNDTISNSDNKNGLIKWHLITMYENGKNDWRFLGTTYENGPFKLSIGLTPDSIRIKTKPNNYNRF
jgi:hypothetical protein